MVRLEVTRKKSGKIGKIVSIPIWCDWKTTFLATLPAEALFQFLYGAIGSAHARVCEAIDSVSIPIWCDWKIRNSLQLKLSPTVSIPIWCDWKQRSPPLPMWHQSFNSYMVRLEEFLPF